MTEPAGSDEPLLPNATDELAHPAPGDALWNESWYFDFADSAAGIGGWIRLGLYPNEGQAWVNGLICGPGLPTVALNDFRAAVPTDPNNTQASGITLSHQAIEPLRSYRVAMHGQGRSFDHPGELLRDGDGSPVPVSIDLVWSTAGRPYRYRLATRYEIPCTVSGTVIVGERSYDVKAAAGQRDHSWGVRDWWSMDWVWSAIHLDDGTHLHAVEVRIPGIDPVALGYLQGPDGNLDELRSVRATEDFGPDGLPAGAHVSVQPGDLELHVTPVGHAPVRLVADDGRVAEFPRAWVKVTTGDGRSGVGWMEWNRNRR